MPNTAPIKPHKLWSDRIEWAVWAKKYGLDKFFDAFMANAQDAESECIYCREAIYLDIAEGGGVPDWRTEDGDYGCMQSPETTEDGTGSHFPRRMRQRP